MKKYIVFFVGGDRDGEEIDDFDNANEAINYARGYYKEHEDEFDPVYGGVGIVDENGKAVEW